MARRACPVNLRGLHRAFENSRSRCCVSPGDHVAAARRREEETLPASARTGWTRSAAGEPLDIGRPLASGQQRVRVFGGYDTSCGGALSGTGTEGVVVEFIPGSSAAAIALLRPSLCRAESRARSSSQACGRRSRPRSRPAKRGMHEGDHRAGVRAGDELDDDALVPVASPVPSELVSYAPNTRRRRCPEARGRPMSSGSASAERVEPVLADAVTSLFAASRNSDVVARARRKISTWNSRTHGATP